MERKVRSSNDAASLSDVLVQSINSKTKIASIFIQFNKRFGDYAVEFIYTSLPANQQLPSYDACHECFFVSSVE